MELEAAYKEIEELKSSMDKLREGYNAKSELSDSLRRAHDEQLAKFQEAKIEIDKQAHELQAKLEEICLAKQLYEDLKSSLNKKESVVMCLSSANEQLRSSCGEKLVKLEGQNRELASALDEANAKVKDQDKKVDKYKDEGEGLRSRLLESQKKCFELEQNAQAVKESRAREELLVQLEHDNAKIGEELKWKKEQFSHLEEAYGKLQDQFRESKVEWEAEISRLVDDICSLQANLESQTRVVEDLSSRLQICNEALAHKESRIKILEIQVSETRASCENAVNEYEEAKLKVEKLTEKRDAEIAEARNLLASKETILKEMEFRKTRLEQENQELKVSLKELQLAQINDAGAASSLKSLRQKFRSLEQAHRDCPANLKAKEAEWSSQIQQLEKNLDECVSQLDSKEKKVQELQLELQVTYSLIMQMKLDNEEMSVMLMVLMSKISEASSRDFDFANELNKAELELKRRRLVAEKESRSKLDAETEMKALQAEIGNIRRELEATRIFYKEREIFLKIIEDKDNKLESIQKELALLEQEFARTKTKAMVSLEQERASFLCISKEKDRAIADLQKTFGKEKESFPKIVEDKDNKLESMKKELALLKQELSRTKTEAMVTLEQERASFLCISKEKESAIADIKKTFEKEKESFQRIVEDKDIRLESMQKELALLEQELARTETEARVTLQQERASFLCISQEKESVIADLQKTFEKENESFFRLVEVKDNKLESIQKELALLEQEFARTKTEAMVTLEQERAGFLHIIKEKDGAIADLQKHILSQEQLSKSVETAITLKLADMQFEINTLYESWEKIAAAHLLDIQEIEYTNAVVRESEEQRDTLKQKLDLVEKHSLGSREYITKLEDELEREKLERKQEGVQFESELERMQSNERTLDSQINELQCRVKEMQESITLLLSDREDMVAQIEEFSDMIVSSQKNEFPVKWERSVEAVKNGKEIVGGEVIFRFNQLEQCLNLVNKGAAVADSRLPLREQNST